MMIPSILKKIERCGVCVSLFSILIFLTVGIGVVCVCQAAQTDCDQLLIDCDRLLSEEGSKDFDSQMIKTLQITLDKKGYDPCKIDGKLGDLTKDALQRYCDDPDETKNEPGMYYLLNEQDIKDLEELEIQNDIIEQLKAIKDVEYANKNLLLNALQEKIDVSCEYRELIAEKTKKKYAFDETKSIKWNNGTCGCVLDDLSGIIYGFYPFWMAGEEQQLDFGVLSRIGYYALTFNDKGDIKERLHLEPAQAQFVHKAHKHRTKVDVVIQKDDWEKWTELNSQEKSQLFDNLITNIVKLVNTKLTHTFSKIKPYVSFGSSPTPTIVDGVTLYFKGYPGYKHDDHDWQLFIKFIKKLKAEFKKMRQDYHLNIMLSLYDIKYDCNNGFYDFGILDEFVPDQKKEENDYNDQNDVDHFLVFIGANTKNTKKTLRENIESSFTGMKRRNMLRKTIPIIKHTGDNEQQFIDDILYMEDNFGGIGLWTLPVSEGSGVELMTCVKEILPWNKIQDENKDILADVVNADLTKFYRKDGAKPISGYQNFVSLHRWGFRILFNLLLAIFMLYALFRAFSCRLRVLSVNFFWWFMSVCFLFVWVFFSLLYFDPSWKKLAEGNLILFLLIFVIVGIAILGYVKKIKQGEIP
ncbi:peptidoglycan-binding domain-containing protein [Desulfobacula phenolica]|uniref:Peptidoglycan binding domain-containing protein n=1 Tax=Desulfobacula phenolica TaxID=90732 RepID=A0A1H2JQN6_9BACT|nr:peptidoglycan-binding domain-containing protein [Desulfobacula phenolica]SDU58441.1 hypothetical protein SAMN04487931_11428 [Desulfobacula phenolica]